MNQGSWVSVTRFWNVSAVKGTEVPLMFGVIAGFAGFFGVGIWKLGVVFDLSDAGLESFEVSAFLVVAGPAALASSFFTSVFVAEILGCSGEELAPGSGSERDLGRDPGFSATKISSMASLRSLSSLTPLNVLCASPFLKMVVVGHADTPIESQKSL